MSVMSRNKQEKSRLNVFIRCRPARSCEDGISTVVFPNNQEIIVQDDAQKVKYKFDHVFSPQTTNNEVFSLVGEPLLTSALSGVNASLMAYGQTATGKTFSMLSPSDGLIPMATRRLFEMAESCSKYSYKVTFSFLQIYQDKIYDLLCGEKNKGSLNLREHPQEGVVIENLVEENLTDSDQCERLLELGKQSLVIIKKNQHLQSRSHAICILKIDKTKSNRVASIENPIDRIIPAKSGKMKAKLFLCDLAGSERLRKPTMSRRQLEETRYINTSLLELGNVIHALTSRSRLYVPFRNSTLTRILKESLGGNSKTGLMVCISPSQNDLLETKYSLNFGQRAMKVVKKTVLNVEPRTDTHWLNYPLFKRRKNRKIDYRALAEYLTNKLKELESAYNQEKENLRLLKYKLSARRSARSGEESSGSESSETTSSSKRKYFLTSKHRSSSKQETPKSMTNTSTQVSLSNLVLAIDNQNENFDTTDGGQSNIQPHKGSQEEVSLQISNSSISTQTAQNSKNVANQTSPIMRYNDTVSSQTSPIMRYIDTVWSQTSPIIQNNETVESQTSPIMRDNDTVSSQTSPIIQNNETVESQTSPIMWHNDTVSSQMSPTIWNSEAVLSQTPFALQNTEFQVSSQTSPIIWENKRVASQTSHTMSYNKTLESQMPRFVERNEYLHTSVQSLPELDKLHGSTKVKNTESTIACQTSFTSLNCQPNTTSTTSTNLMCTKSVNTSTKSMADCSVQTTIHEAQIDFFSVDGQHEEKDINNNNNNTVVEDRVLNLSMSENYNDNINSSSKSTKSNRQRRADKIEARRARFFENVDFSFDEEPLKSPTSFEDKCTVTDSLLDDGSIKAAPFNPIATQAICRSGGQESTDKTPHVILDLNKSNIDSVQSSATVDKKKDDLIRFSIALEQDEELETVKNFNSIDLSDESKDSSANAQSQHKTLPTSPPFEELDLVTCVSAHSDEEVTLKEAIVLRSPTSDFGYVKNIGQASKQKSFKSLELNEEYQDNSLPSPVSSYPHESIESETEDIYHEDTRHAKKSLKKVQHRYSLLLNQLNELTRELSTADDNDEEIGIAGTPEGECYDIILKFKTELEEELEKAKQKLKLSNDVNMVGDDIPTATSQQENTLLPNAEVHVADGEGGSCDSMTTPSGTFDADYVIWSRKQENTRTSSPTTPKHSSQYLELNNNEEDQITCTTEHQLQSPSGVLDLTDDNDTGSQIRSIHDEDIDCYHVNQQEPQLNCESSNAGGISNSREKNQKNYEKQRKLTMAAIENAEIKKELLLTKLEKLRLEAVLSCVLIDTESNDMTKEFQQLSRRSKRCLTSSSKSTLASAASCAHLPSLSSPASTFKSLQSPVKKYNYRERFYVTPDHMKNELRIIGRPSFSTASPSVTRSVQTEKNVVDWLNSDASMNSKSMQQPEGDEETSCRSSLDFDVSSMSDLGSPMPLRRRLSPCGQDKSPYSGKDFVHDMDFEDIDKLLIRYKKKKPSTFSSLLCFKFLRSRKQKMRESLHDDENHIQLSHME